MDKLDEVLKGLDETETCSEAGWWETSSGAEFGAEKLAEVKALFAELEQERDYYKKGYKLVFDREQERYRTALKLALLSAACGFGLGLLVQSVVQAV